MAECSAEYLFVMGGFQPHGERKGKIVLKYVTTPGRVHREDANASVVGTPGFLHLIYETVGSPGFIGPIIKVFAASVEAT